MSEVLRGVVVGVIMLAVGALAGRLTLRTKTQEDVRKISGELLATKQQLSSHISLSEERNGMILESLLAILLTLKKGRANGEADAALKKLNEFMLKNSSLR